MRTRSLIVALAVMVGAPMAQAQVEPEVTLTLEHGSEIAFHSPLGEAGGDEPLAPFVRVWNFFDDSGVNFTFEDCAVAGSLVGCNNAPEPGPVDEFGAQPSGGVAIYNTALGDYVADPWSNTIWRFSPELAGFPSARTRQTTPSGDPLNHPVAVAASGTFIFYGEGLLPAGGDVCGGCLPTQPAGFHGAPAAQTGFTFSSWGDGEGQLPPNSTRAVTLWLQDSGGELYIVSGEPARVLVYDVSTAVGFGTPSAIFTHNFPVPGAYQCGNNPGQLKNPTEIRVMADGRIVIGDGEALVVMDQNGNILGEIWSRNAPVASLNETARLMSIGFCVVGGASGEVAAVSSASIAA